jgi:hypothetical protein
MADIRVRLGSENAIKVSSTSVTSIDKLYQLSDVDISNGQVGGMILVFNSTTLKWEATSNPVLVGSLSVNGNTTLGQISTNLNTFIGISSFFGKVSIAGSITNAGPITNTGGATFDNIKIASNIISSSPGSGDTLYIDPYPVGINTGGKVIIKGDLQIYGDTTFSGISTRGSAYFDSSGKLISTNSPEVGYASTSNYILTTDNSNVPVWTNTIDGGQY